MMAAPPTISFSTSVSALSSDTQHGVDFTTTTVSTTNVCSSRHRLWVRSATATSTFATRMMKKTAAVAVASATRLASTVSDVDDSYDDDVGASAAFGGDTGYNDGGKYNEPKDQLLMALATKDKLFGDKNSRISTLAKELAGYAMPLMPSNEPYRLLYTDAPDLLGFQGGPVSELVSISQTLTTSTEMEIILEYKPSKGITNLVSTFIPDIINERLQQIIYMEYTKEPMNKIDIKIKGTKLQGTRFGGTNGGGLPALTSPTSIPLPFGSFKVLFHDDDLCIQQTIQGEFLFIYQKEQ